MSARSFIICLLAAFALGFGSAALIMKGDADSANFKRLAAKGDSIQVVVDSLQPMVEKDAKQWLEQAPARAAKDTAQMAVVNEARAKAMQAAVDAEKAVMDIPEHLMVEHPAVKAALGAKDSVISAQVGIIKAQDARIRTLTASRNRLSVFYARAVSANSALDAANKNLRAQVKQLRADVRMASVKSKMGFGVASGITGAWAFSAGGIGPNDEFSKGALGFAVGLAVPMTIELVKVLR